MYNKNTLSLIPNLSKIAIKFIRDYFYLYNRKAERKIRRKRIYNRRRKLSISRIFLSKGEFKHTNNKVIITLYVYNKQKNNYLQKLKQRYINKIFENIVSFKNNNIIETISNKKNILSNKLILLKKLKKISINGTLALIDANFFKPRVARILRDLQIRKKIIFLGNLIKKENLYKKVLYYNSFLYKNILNNIKYKHLAGFRLEAKGRLSRRYTASRSINKIKYKGNLLNIDSSYKGLSSELLRNNLNSNLQYTKLNSKTRIGSFGLKG